MNDIPASPPEWLLRQAFLRTMRGEQIWPTEDEPGNVVSIAAARTRRATELSLRARAPRERPL
jgi:hypothetical protein